MLKRLMKNHNSNDLSHHILSNSATMVGVCTGQTHINNLKNSTLRV
jgi:hypothetical protein